MRSKEGNIYVKPQTEEEVEGIYTFPPADKQRTPTTKGMLRVLCTAKYKCLLILVFMILAVMEFSYLLIKDLSKSNEFNSLSKQILLKVFNQTLNNDDFALDPLGNFTRLQDEIQRL